MIKKEINNNTMKRSGLFTFLILGFMGLVTKYSLRKMRNYVYVGFAVVSATLTPPDVITMLGLWVPLVLLFEIGVLAVALVVHPYLARQHS